MVRAVKATGASSLTTEAISLKTALVIAQSFFNLDFGVAGICAPCEVTQDGAADLVLQSSTALAAAFPKVVLLKIEFI